MIFSQTLKVNGYTAQPIPVRLEIAARLVSQLSADTKITKEESSSAETARVYSQRIAFGALFIADALIAEHNKSIEIDEEKEKYGHREL